MPFRVLLDGQRPGDPHGLDIDEDGQGTLAQQRLHELIHQLGPIMERTLEVTFLAPNVEAYCSAFG